MNLTYRGISYEASVTGTEAPATEEMGTFLGKPYPIKRTRIAQRHASAELTYRGVRYSR